MRKLLLGILLSFFLLQLPALAASSITVTSPNGGETLAKGSTVTITWTSTNVSYVYLDLTNTAGGYGYGDSITNLVNVDGNPGSASWAIPTNVNAGTYKLKIGTCTTKANRNDCSGSIADVYDYSDSTITLTGCSIDSDCAMPANPWAGATFCDPTGMKVMQYKITPKCISGTCNNQQTAPAVKEDCTPSSKICDFTTAGGGVYACIAGTPPSTCAANSQITTRCICGSGVYGGAYYTWSGYDPGYCCGSGSSASQISPGPCSTTTTTTTTTVFAPTNQSNTTTTTYSPPSPGATSPPSQSTPTTQTGATSPAVLSNATTTSTTFSSATTSLPTTTTFQATTTTIFMPEKFVPSACTDSDRGMSIFSQGITSDDSGVFEDKCIENNLTEYYCKDGAVLSYITTCSDGCNNGACISTLEKLIQDLIALLKSIFGLK